MASRRVAPLPSRASSFDSHRDPDDPSGSRIGASAARTYKQTWDDFYKWKAENDKVELNQLCVSSPGVYLGWKRPDDDDARGSSVADDDDWNSQHSYPSSYSPSEPATDLDHNDMRDLDNEMSFLAFEDTTLAADSKILIQVYRHLPEELMDTPGDLWHDQSYFMADSYWISLNSGSSQTSDRIDGDFLPHPRYFSCTATTNNSPPLTQKSDGLAFSPFEDDLVFDHHRYLMSSPSFDWQADFVDPDVEVVQHEVARRLHYELGLSFSQINKLKILTNVRKTHESGLVWDTSQRDLLFWSGAGLSELPQLRLSELETIPPDHDLFAHLKIGSRAFCPNLNCIHAACGIHRDFGYPHLQPINPTLTSHQLQLLKGKPCRNHCFRHLDVANATDWVSAIDWENEQSVQVLRGILNICPDVLPCDLAVMMHAKCQDVFIYRTRFFADDSIEDNTIFEQNWIMPGYIFEDDPSMSDYKDAKATFTPIKVPVAVTLDVNVLPRDIIVNGAVNAKPHASDIQFEHLCSLLIYDDQVHFAGKGALVHMNLALGGKRARRMIVHVGQPVGSVILNCVGLVMQEVGKKFHKRFICSNVSAQRAQYPLLYIGRGSWGLGAFTTQKIVTNQVIGEYTGELLTLESDADTDKVSPIPHYTGLNYKFDLNSTYIIDSMYMGNEMRYLNHAGPTTKEEVTNPTNTRSTANCHGKVVYVNNCHRILFIADRRIEANSELFIDYGLSYWTEKDEWLGAKEMIYWR
ncbi:hypothetical protein D9756_008181 [Leucocoprinus leucothites]|uniref:SET domain-containing protein n=1 Tax=Leucocoprinus leucothites TaxID=201217 RepID=A0A8H5D2W4_9AGAR|nr:hypothetical protein D9756_008181 [Leucoagaricus leucothites]